MSDYFKIIDKDNVSVDIFDSIDEMLEAQNSLEEGYSIEPIDEEEFKHLEAVFKELDAPKPNGNMVLIRDLEEFDKKFSIISMMVSSTSKVPTKEELNYVWSFLNEKT